MIAEEADYNQPIPETSIQIGMHLESILSAFIDTTPKFKNHILKFTHKILNEEELTQEFVNLLRRETTDMPFLISNEKKDLYQFTSGRSDFYFYQREQDATTESFFDVEAKILTDKFPKAREKEYVKGDKNNGGIERYKTEDHGSGLNKCAILGFIKENDSVFWIKKINSWILELTKLDTFWSEKECLKKEKTEVDFSIFKSITQRKKLANIELFHFWLNL
jgi:hypothetical protein